MVFPNFGLLVCSRFIFLRNMLWSILFTCFLANFKQLKEFTCSIILLSIKIWRLSGYYPLNATNLVLCTDTVKPCLLLLDLINAQFSVSYILCSSSSFVMSYALINLFWPPLIVSSKVFQAIFLHFVYNSASFLASCCSSFSLHVTPNLICIFLVSHQLVFTFNSSKISSFLLWSKSGYPAVLLQNLILTDVNHILSYFLMVQILLPYKRIGKASAIYTFILEIFWTKVGL